MWFKMCQSDEPPIRDFDLEMGRLEREEDVFGPLL